MSDIAFLLKIFQGDIDSPELLGKFYINTPKKLTRHTKLLYVPPLKTNYLKNTFVNRAPRSFNSANDNIDFDIFNTSIPGFKKLYNNGFF